MVKGVSKQAVIVPSPDPGKFEQAIFIVSGQAQPSVQSGDDMIALACQLASRYSVSPTGTGTRIRRTVVPALSFVLGSGLTVLALFMLGML